MRCAAGLTSWRVSCPPACPIGSRAHHFMSPFLLSDAQPASRPRSPHTSVQHTTGLRLEESEAEVKVSIVLADDHRVVREGLRMLLEVKGGATVVAEAGDVVGARRALREHNPDVLVLDVNMPGESGLSALSRLREEFPETAIVVLTMQADPQLAREALREGRARLRPHVAGPRTPARGRQSRDGRTDLSRPTAWPPSSR